MYTPKGSWVLPGEAPNSPSANTHVLPTHLFLCRLAVNALARLHAPCACRFLTRDLYLRSLTYIVGRGSREPPVHSQTFPDSSPER